MNATTEWKIERDGFYFRAVRAEFRSIGFTSASQAGLFIERKAGKEAHADAAESFLASQKKVSA